MSRQVCPAAITLIKNAEGFRATAYLCPAGKPTIGFGHTSGVTAADVGKRTISCEQATRILMQDLDAFAGHVEKSITVPLTDNQFGALVSFTYNLGSGNLNSSTMRKRLNAGDYAVGDEFLRWDRSRVNGKMVSLPGLTTRRKAERALFEAV